MPRRRASDLKRRRYSREPKRHVLIFCEGRNTEPAYFNALKRAFSSALIEVETIAPAGVPYTLAKSATDWARSLGLARRSRKPRNSYEEGDEVWAVFDRDEHPRFKDAVEICRLGNVAVGRSDPCFNLWLILHEQDFDRPDDRHAVQAHLQTIRPEYGKDGAKTPDCADMVTRAEEAERRAEEQLTRREEERTPFGCPSTTVGRLTRAIRDAVREASGS